MADFMLSPSMGPQGLVSCARALVCLMMVAGTARDYRPARPAPQYCTGGDRQSTAGTRCRHRDGPHEPEPAQHDEPRVLPSIDSAV
jgi:hypothetical protein